MLRCMKKILIGLQTTTKDSIHYDAQLKNNNKYFHNIVVLKPPLQNPLKLASWQFWQAQQHFQLKSNSNNLLSSH